ncbi:unnamed protein product [Rotaria socialis]
MMENSFIFTMDSGPFLDIIPILLGHLDLLSLIRLAQACRFWKRRIYGDLKLWPNVIELPFICQMRVYDCKCHDTEKTIQVKLWSMVLPPEDPKALETILEKMTSSEESIRRFRHVEKVLFKNFIHTDVSLRFTSLLFPSIKEISFEGHRQNLERFFTHDSCWSTCKTQLNLPDSIPFMALCRRCGLPFNELKNEKEMLRLYLPGTYSRYGHSCSSFNCCGSGIPQYASSLECQYSHHTKCVNLSSKWHPEYMFLKFEPDKFPLVFTSRRNLNPCYAVWNKTQQHQNKTSEMNESIHVFSDFR